MFKVSFKGFMLALVLGCSYLPMHSTAAPIVNLALLDTDIAVGDSFDVGVWVDGDGIGLELLAFGFDVNTTGGFFTFDGYSIESGFDDDSPFVPPAIAGSILPDPSSAPVDDLLLATLGFTATAVGTGSLQTLGLADGLFFGLAYEIDPITIGWYDINASLDIAIKPATSSNPIPEPPPMLLLSAGLVVLSWLSRTQTDPA